MGLHFHFPQQRNSMLCSEARVELWFGYNSYLCGGVLIFYSSVVAHSLCYKSEEQNCIVISCNNDDY